jgi:excisionase family DNA binding protein
MDELWDISRVADYLGVTERTVYNKVRSGELPAVKVGRLWRVRRVDLEAWLSASTPGAPVAKGVWPGGTIAIPPRSALVKALDTVPDALERRLVFVGALSDAVQTLGWSAPVVVGGHAVEFYTAGGYTTVDIDLAGASEPISEVLGDWGFGHEGRYWHDAELGLVVEVPGSTLPQPQQEHATTLGIGPFEVRVIGIEDLIVDRLSACKHWNHSESCAWAVTLLQVAEELDDDYLRERAEAEDVADTLANARRDVDRE